MILMNGIGEPLRQIHSLPINGCVWFIGPNGREEQAQVLEVEQDLKSATLSSSSVIWHARFVENEGWRIVSGFSKVCLDKIEIV